MADSVTIGERTKSFDDWRDALVNGDVDLIKRAFFMRVRATGGRGVSLNTVRQSLATAYPFDKAQQTRDLNDYQHSRSTRRVVVGRMLDDIDRLRADARSIFRALSKDADLPCYVHTEIGHALGAAYVESLAQQGIYGARVGYGEGWKRGSNGALYWGKGPITSRGSNGSGGRSKARPVVNDAPKPLPWQIDLATVETHLAANTLPHDDRARALIVFLGACVRFGSLAPAFVEVTPRTLLDARKVAKSLPMVEAIAARDSLPGFPTLHKCDAALRAFRGLNGRAAGTLTASRAPRPTARTLKPTEAYSVLLRAYAGANGRPADSFDRAMIRTIIAPRVITDATPITLTAADFAQAIHVGKVDHLAISGLSIR